jgi:hypothetical protein
MNKALLIGASDSIGGTAYKKLNTDCDNITADHTSSDFQVDPNQSDSIKEPYDNVGQVDAIICCAAKDLIFSAIKNMYG